MAYIRLQLICQKAEKGKPAIILHGLHFKQIITMNAFEALGLNENLVQAVADLGFTEPTPIQQQAIMY